MLNIFSKRQKQLRGEVPDVFQYTDIPLPLRTQIVHIIKDGLGDSTGHSSPCDEVYCYIHDSLCREYGRFSLDPNGGPTYPHHGQGIVLTFLLKATDIEQALDVVEMAFKLIEVKGSDYMYRHEARLSLSPEEAITS